MADKTYTRKLHWTDRRRAQANIGEALQDQGWTLFGYHADNSDSMTDYYDPASWAGVATHPDFPGVVVGVAVDGYVVNQHSGKDEIHSRPKETGNCSFCNGTGVDPSGVTYSEAQADFTQYHFNVRAREQGAVSLLPRVISPLHFFEDGRPKCLRCGGSGKVYTAEHFTACTWPTFQATPKGRAWHIEINGKIIATGTGLAESCDFGSEGREGANRVTDAILAALASATAPKPEQAAPTTAEVKAGDARIEYDRDWTWIYFPGKPAEAVREALKSLGFRFSGKRVGWYTTEHVPQEQLAGVIA